MARTADETAGEGRSVEDMVPLKFRVRRKVKETRDTWTLVLEPDGTGARGLPFQPGQFNMLYAFGRGEAPISFSGDPAKDGVTVHTVRAVGAVTRTICGMKRGDVIGVRGPFGSHWPVREAEGNDILIIGGGIGLAPLRPALYAVLANRKKYGRVVLLYGCRTPDDILFRKELEKWRGRFDLDVDVTVDHAGGDWYGNVGVVTRLISRSTFDPFSTVAMVCGPELMMRYTAQELLKQDVDAGNIHLTMERNMKCAAGFCGHCQYGPEFVCRDGPVFPYERIERLFMKREI